MQNLRQPHVHIAQYELVTWTLRTPGMSPAADRVFRSYIEFVADAYQRAELPRLADLDASRELAHLSVAAFDGMALQYHANRDESAARHTSSIQVDFLIQRAIETDRLHSSA